MPHPSACDLIRFNGMLSVMPTTAWDAAIGACAGAAAVMVSMPCDTVKTYLQTHASGRLNTSSSAQLALFISTGKFDVYSPWEED